MKMLFTEIGNREEFVSGIKNLVSYKLSVGVYKMGEGRLGLEV